MFKNNPRFALIFLGSLMLAACGEELYFESNEGPVFTVSSNTISVPEDIIGIIYDANATDADGDTITYSISGGADSIHFSIGNSSGELSFQSPPDYGNPSDSDDDNIYQIQLSVSDGVISVSMQLTVIVRSTNQAPNASISVSPDPEITILTTDTEITLDGSVSSDPDGDTIAYTWSQDQNINLSSEDGPSTRFTATTPGTYTFTLTVSDGEKADSSTLALDIFPVSVAPNFTSPDTVRAKENYSGVIYTATATDADADDTLSYSIVGGADRKLFSLSGAELSFINAANYEDAKDSDGDNTYEVLLRVTDSYDLYADLNLSISVDDINEAPAFTSSVAVSIDENYSGVIYSATADDVDAGDTMNYSIAGGVDQSFFSLEGAELSVTGAIRVGADSDGDSIYQVQLRVTDAMGLYDELNLSVSVDDVNEAPIFTSAYAISIDENQSGVIYTAAASDIDAGDTITYSIIGGADQDLFNLRADELSLTADLDYENPIDSDGDNTYELILRATDSGGLYADLNLSASIADVNEAPTFTSAYAISVDENQSRVIYTAAASDVDAGDTITYSIIGGADRAVFILSADELNLTADLDYENPIDSDGDNTYELILRATDSGGLYADLNLSVSVADINEAPIVSISVSPDPDITTLTTAAEITLDGSASSDPDSDNLDYTWSQPDNQSIDLSSTSTASTTFIAANPGTYTFTLTVNDGAIDHSAEITLEIAQANRAPTASISVSPDPDSTTLTTATKITLNGSSSSDPDGDTLTYEWSQPSNQSIDLSSTSTASTTFTAAAAGTYTFTLTVSDNELEDSSEAIVTVHSMTIPNDFTATASSTQVTLTWTPYSNSTSYSIYLYSVARL